MYINVLAKKTVQPCVGQRTRGTGTAGRITASPPPYHPRYISASPGGVLGLLRGAAAARGPEKVSEETVKAQSSQTAVKNVFISVDRRLLRFQYVLLAYWEKRERGLCSL